VGRGALDHTMISHHYTSVDSDVIFSGVDGIPVLVGRESEQWGNSMTTSI
jgi:hypothetical protein